MKFPILFASNDTDFFSLGLGPMTNTLEATVTEERNGSFYFDAKVIIDDQCYPLLEENRIIRADASPELLDQRFRIKKITDNHDGTAQVYAEHTSYLTQELSLKPQVSAKGTGFVALNAWKNGIIDSNPFTVDSNVTTDAETFWRIDEVQNARQALGGVKGSILDKWGGEYRFDNYHISLLQKRGTTANVLLAYGRNITDFEQERNITDTYNSLYPYAIYTDDKQNEHLVTLPEYFVDAENIANFPNRKAFPIDFSDQFKQDEVPTATKLKSLAQSYIKSNDIGIPKVSIKVSFVDLAKTTDYADIAPLEKLNLCDEVRVIYPKLNVNTTAKVVRVVWNVLAESYNEIEIGEKRASLADKLNEQSQSIKEVNTQVNNALTSANGKNTNFYGLYGEDGLGQPTATKIGDLWYKPNGEYTEMYQWNGTVWELIFSDEGMIALNKELDENIKKVEQAEKELEQTKMDLVQNTKDIEQNKLDIEQNIKDTEAAAKQLAADKLILDQTNKDLAQAKADLAADKIVLDQTKSDLVQTKIDLENDKAILDKTAKDLEQTKKDLADDKVMLENTKSDLEQTKADLAADKLILEQTNKDLKKTKADLADDKVILEQTAKDLAQTKIDLVADRVVLDQTNKDLEQTKKDLSEAKNMLDQTSADLVVTNKKLENDKKYIDDVKAQADAMSTKIDNQQSIIDTSNQLANAAKSTSDQAVKDVQTANALAKEAKSISTSAQSDAAIAKANASTAVSNASTAMTNAKNSLDKANSIDQTVQTEVKRIDGELSSKATKTSLDTLNGTVSNQTTLITQNQNDIKLKANQSTVDTLNQTVSIQGTSIESNAKAISLKASQTDVNAISGRVSSAESSIKVNADSIKSLVLKTDGTNTQLSSLNQDVNGFKQQVINDYVTINDLQKISADSMIQNGNFTGGSLYWNLGSTSSVKNSNLNGVTNYVQLNGFQTAYYTGNIAFKKNRKYRISFLAYTQKGWTGDNQNAKLRLGDRTDGSYLVDIQVVSDSNNQDKWIPFEKIYTSTKDLQDVELSLKNTTNNNSFIGYANVMIVDVTDVIEVSSNLSQFKQDVEGFQSLVASTYETKDVVSSKVTKVSQDLGTFKVAVSDTYSTKGDLNSTNVKVANLSLSQSKFETTVSETYLPTDIFEKAGNSGNIINNGDFLNKDLYWSLPPNASFGTLSSKGNYLYVANTSDGAIRSSVYKPRVSFLKNRSYRVVFDINVSSDYNGPGGNTKFRIGDRSSGGNALIYDIAYPSQRNQWVTVTGTIKFNTDYSNCEVSFQYGGTKGGVSIGSVLIYDITDITETNSTVATLTQTVSGFQQTVAQTYETKDGVASKIATVNQTISGIRTTVGETQAALEKKMDNEAYNTQNSNGDNSGKWVRFLYTKVPARYSEVQLSLDILSNGSGDGKLRACRLLVRHKQQNPLGTSNPTLMLEMDNVTNMSTGDIRAVLIYNNETEGSTIAYYIRMDTSYLGYSISPYNRSGGGSVSYISYGDWVSFPSNANAWDATYGGSYEKATFIEQQVSSLKLGVVMKDKVVSSINLNPEGIRLQGKLITLDGTSYIANGVIKDSHIENATIQTASIADVAITNGKIANLAVSTAKIAELAVQNGKIADLAVTGAKIANATITSANIANAAIQEAHIDKAVITNAKIANLAVSTAKIAELAVQSGKIADLAITNAKIADAAITNAKIGKAAIQEVNIADAAITNAKIENLAVSTAKIAELSVQTGKIADSAITNAKIENLAVSTAKIAELAVQTGKIADLAVTNAKIENLAVSTAKIAELSVQTGKIADAAITNAKIENLAVSTAKIAELAVQNGKIADLAVTNAKIADATITTVKIGNAAITEAKIGDLAVTNSKIGNAAITEAKIGEAAIINAHIKDATIESAKIRNVSADKITVGTLNGANVNVINLNANNITTGQLTGITVTSYNSASGRIAKINDGSLLVTQDKATTMLSPTGLKNWYSDTNYGFDLDFTTQGMSVKPWGNNTGLWRNVGFDLYGNNTYIDFHNRGNDEKDYGARLWMKSSGDFELINTEHPLLLSAPSDQAVVTQSGSLSVRNTTNTGYVTVYAGDMISNGKVKSAVGMYAPFFDDSSSRKLKYDIKDLENGFLEKLKSLELKRYKRSDVEGLRQLGVILEDNLDADFTSKTGVDLYSYITFVAKALQETINRIEKMEEAA